MRTFAYCCLSFSDSARRAAGVRPVTCPPTSDATITQQWHGPYDLVYLDLHGRKGATRWYGDGGTVALRADQVRELDLHGAVIFAVNCYLGDDDSPMLDALLDAGATYVIGGAGRNWAGRRTVMGAARLGKLFRHALAAGIPVLRGLAVAKSVLGVGKLLPGAAAAAVVDALDFKAFYRLEAPRDEGEHSSSEEEV
jgi:hypothetical protein